MKEKRWWGLDLGSRAVKLAEVEQTPSGYRVIRHLVRELPHPSTGQAVDPAGVLTSALRELAPEEVHLAVGGPEVVVRRVTLPGMPARELPQALRTRLRDELPFPVEKAVVDFRVVGETWEKEIKKLDLLAAAAPRGWLEQRIRLLEGSGVRIGSLVPSSLALWAALNAAVPQARKGAVAVVEMGAARTEMMMVREGVVWAVRTLPLGTAHLLEALVGETASDRGKIRVDLSQAQQYSRRYGVVGQQAPGATEEGIPLAHLFSLMRPVLEQILTEIARFLDFYKMKMLQPEVSRLFLCGGGANLKGLAPWLSQGLGLPVERFNPAGSVEEGSGLAVAVGAALLHGGRIQLLPAEQRRTQRWALWRSVGFSAAKGLAAAAVGVCLALWLWAGFLHWQLARAQAAWAQVQPAYARYRDLSVRRAMVEGSFQGVERFLDQEPVWEGVLKEIGVRLPDSLQMESIRIWAEGDSPLAHRVVLKGGVRAGEASGQGAVSEFLEALEESIFFREVELEQSHLEAGGRETTRFEITGVLE